MARPLKSGVDYFPFDTGFFRDDKIRLIKSEFGAKGILVLLALLCEIYEYNGYFKRWDWDRCLLMSDGVACGCSPEFVAEVVQGCVKRSVFDEGVLNVFGVLTSPGIQRRYVRAVAKRDDIAFIEEYFLLDLNDEEDVPASIRKKVYFKSVSDGNKPVSGNGNPVNSHGNPQSKVKESKVKKSREETSGGGNARAREGPPLPDDKNNQGAGAVYCRDNLTYMSDGAYRELRELMEYGVADDLIITAVDEACAQGKRSWSYTRSILNRWIAEGVRTPGEAKANSAQFKARATQRTPSKQGAPPADSRFDAFERMKTDPGGTHS